MRGKGINYDTGFFPGGRDSRPRFAAETARREMRIIAEDLHCTAVRITGGDPERLSVAAGYAAEARLEVWFSPFPCELTTEELLPFFADCAERAEQIRRTGAEVVFVTGCELTLFAHGFLDGADTFERINTLTNGGPALWSTLGALGSRLGAFLAEAAAAVRPHFGGKLSYASGTWEFPGWGPFDYVGVDAYRDAHNAAGFRSDLRRSFAHGKPVAVAEFGCCTYVGAADKGGMGWAILDRSTEPLRLNDDYVRSEAEQVGYLKELLSVFEDEGVDSAFWFTFVNEEAAHRPAEPRADLDMAAYSVVKMLADDGGGGDGAAGEQGTHYPGLGWAPKEAFYALAEAYAEKP
jgi:hypothetical protein